MRRGITVDGQREALTTICEWLDAWRQDCAAGPWWPEWITMADLRTGRPSQSCPARPSWCYGTPGIARAGQLAGIATGDAHRQQRYEEALVRCLDDPAQQARITNNGLCHGWAGVYQLYIQFSDWSDAEQAAADHLAPLLRHAEEDGVVTAWWFMRKHPCWRLRLQPGPAGRTMKAGLDAAFDELAADGRIGSWSPGIYEAETAAFGGDAGMDLAPELFCADSRAVLDLLRNGGSGLGRRELSLLLCSILMRAAGLEWYEQATSGTESHGNDACPPTSRPRS